MNGYECGGCGQSPCVCREREKTIRIKSGRDVAEVGIDVFSKVKRRRMKIIKWIWPDIQRLTDALYDFWDKSDRESKVKSGLTQADFDAMKD